ncbi:MAG: hypothetical protein FWF69_07490 [Firmicutes bacterium]|nr:hypothetical protein [Bacillota bacterium]
MMDMIRADVYRIIRGKALYITFAVLLLLNILMVATAQELTVGIQMAELEESLGYRPGTNKYDGVNIASVLYTNMNITIFFVLSLLILVISPIFSHGTVKNDLSCGMSRTRLYFAKLILSSLLCVVLEVGYMASGMLLATAMRGFIGPVPSGYWQNLLKICSSQLFILLAFNCFGTFLAFTSKRTAIVNGAYIAFCLVPSLIIMFLSNANEGFLKLYDYDLMGALKKLGYMNALTGPDILKAFAAGAFYTAASTVAGVALFKRAEIK